jgi:tetratricopeptide (TPR) repeat protein
MKRTAVFVLMGTMLFSSIALANNMSIIPRDEISLKAGPTEPGEGLSLVWLECYVYPKVLKEERVIALGIRTTSKVKGVTAVLDSKTDKIPLTSSDGLSWNGVCKMPDNAAEGIHVVRYFVRGDKGSIRRTVDFFVEKSDAKETLAKGVAQGEALYPQSWSLTVTSTCSALVGASSRILYAGQKVIGVSKIPWYKVVFEDGEEGWISSVAVKEPVGEQHALGKEAYNTKKYADAIEYYTNILAIDSDDTKALIGLAKSYYQRGEPNAAYRFVMEAVHKDDRDMDAKLFASTLAKKFYEIASRDLAAGRFNEAVANYQKVIELKPSSTTSWIELGQCYSRLGLPFEARTAWREALKIEPENNEIRVLLDKFQYMAAAKKEGKLWEKIASKSPSVLPSTVAEDTLQCVRTSRTQKGTKIESALRSVMALTKSLGTPVVEKGWQTYKQGDKFLVRYLCEQGSGMLEAFEWMVDIDTKKVSANNDNARLLVNRW